MPESRAFPCAIQLWLLGRGNPGAVMKPRAAHLLSVLIPLYCSHCLLTREMDPVAAAA